MGDEYDNEFEFMPQQHKRVRTVFKYDNSKRDKKHQIGVPSQSLESYKRSQSQIFSSSKQLIPMSIDVRGVHSNNNSSPSDDLFAIYNDFQGVHPKSIKQGDEAGLNT